MGGQRWQLTGAALRTTGMSTTEGTEDSREHAFTKGFCRCCFSRFLGCLRVFRAFRGSLQLVTWSHQLNAPGGTRSGARRRSRSTASLDAPKTTTHIARDRGDYHVMRHHAAPGGLRVQDWSAALRKAANRRGRVSMVPDTKAPLSAAPARRCAALSRAKSGQGIGRRHPPGGFTSARKARGSPVRDRRTRRSRGRAGRRSPLPAAMQASRKDHWSIESVRCAAEG